MDISLPTSGCNISQSVGYIDNYTNGVRTRYLINENQLVPVYRTTYQYNPNDYYCLHTGDIIYKPELSIYFPVIAGGLILIATAIIFKIIIGRLLK